MRGKGTDGEAHLIALHHGTGLRVAKIIGIRSQVGNRRRDTWGPLREIRIVMEIVGAGGMAKRVDEGILGRVRVEELAATYESPEDVINWYYGNKEQLASIESAVLEDQVFDYIIGEAKVTDKEVSYQEVLQAEPKQAETEDTESE